jgi:DNA-binding CsgD family transcriptional regulator
VKKERADVRLSDDRGDIRQSMASFRRGILMAMGRAGQLRELERQKIESDQRLAALRRKEQEAAYAAAGLTRAKSESVSGHDDTEPVQKTVGQPMATQAPLGTTRNAKHAKKHDLSRYLDVAHLTDRQYQCSSLKWEFELSVSEIARKLELHRTTVDQHIHSAQAKMRSSGLYEKMRKNLSRVQPEE